MMINGRSHLNPFSRPPKAPLSAEHRAILDELRKACAEMDATYRLTWHLHRYPTRFEQMRNAIRAA